MLAAFDWDGSELLGCPYGFWERKLAIAKRRARMSDPTSQEFLNQRAGAESMINEVYHQTGKRAKHTGTTKVKNASIATAIGTIGGSRLDGIGAFTTDSFTIPAPRFFVFDHKEKSMVLDWTLQDAVIDELSRVRSADRVPMGHNDVETELLDNYHAKATAREFSFESDEPASLVGGQNRGPRPLEYFLAGFALCQQVIYAKNALTTGIEFTNLSMEVHGDVDPRGVHGVDNVPPGFANDRIRYTTRIESPATRDEVRQLVEAAERYCPAHASLRKPMSFERTVLLNGEPLKM